VPGFDLSNLPSVGETIRQHGLAPLKHYGQHFLTDPSVLDRIARAAGDLAGATVIEIGPGPGGLTRALLAAGAGQVVAIEYDRRCVAALQPLVACSQGRLQILEQDALAVDVTTIGQPPRVVVANLPYNISTALLVNWLKSARSLQRMTLMFQKEVAERLVARPRTKQYGRLSVLAQTFCHIRRDFNLPAGAFYPPPKVESTVVSLTPKESALPCAPQTLELCTRLAFGQRRKMLRASLRNWHSSIDGLLDAAGVLPTQRAEELAPEDFVRLAVVFEAMAGPG